MPPFTQQNFCLALFAPLATIAVAGMFFALGCGPDKATIVQKKIDERVSEFKEKKELECRMSLLDDAEKIVDSLLLDEAKQELNDSLIRMRPSRPAKPADVPAIDSNAVAPIVKAASATSNK